MGAGAFNAMSKNPAEAPNCSTQSVDETSCEVQAGARRRINPSWHRAIRVSSLDEKGCDVRDKGPVDNDLVATRANRTGDMPIVVDAVVLAQHWSTEVAHSAAIDVDAA
jgi:hypothetical protein